MIVALPVESVALFFKTYNNKPFANKCHGSYAINKGVYHLLTYLLSYLLNIKLSTRTLRPAPPLRIPKIV